MPGILVLFGSFTIFVGIVLLRELWWLISNIYIMLRGDLYKGICVMRTEYKKEAQTSDIESSLSIFDYDDELILSNIDSQDNSNTIQIKYPVIWTDRNNIEHSREFSFSMPKCPPFIINV